MHWQSPGKVLWKAAFEFWPAFIPQLSLDITIKEEKPVLASVLATKEGTGSLNHDVVEEDEENQNKNGLELDKENAKSKGKLGTPNNTTSSATKHQIWVNLC